MIEDHDYRHPGMGNGTGCAVMVAEGALCDRGEIEHWTTLSEWDKQARRAVEWGIVYENPEAIVTLVAKVRAIEALAVEWAANDQAQDRSTLLTFAEAAAEVRRALGMQEEGSA